MIKLIDYFQNGTEESDGVTIPKNICIFYADTKAEVGDIDDIVAEVENSIDTDSIAAGSVVYTAKREVGVIDSNDNIVWG